VDNVESWLSFTDLVFIDPIGTGFSRSLPQDKDSPDKPGETSPNQADKPREAEFWEVERDLKALGEFIQRFLSPQALAITHFHCWRELRRLSGCQVSRKLQQEFGVGLSGAILISPAMEFSLLGGNDYNLTSWATLLPSLAAAAFITVALNRWENRDCSLTWLLPNSLPVRY
jgi:hypothetical protein